ncbi:MAG: aldehyde reductase [Bacteroidota bacterium]
MSEKVLLTGVTGFIGSHTAIQLLECGYEVVGTLRSMARAEEIKAVIAEHTKQVDKLSFQEAELLDTESWRRAITPDITYVQHIASPLPRELPKTADELIVPARDGALNVLRAAAQAGVKRVVMTSSMAAISYGTGKKQGTFNETHWSNEDVHADHTFYTRSKTVAEKAAWEFMEQDDSGMELSVINPVAVLGPILEKDYGTSADFVKKMMDGSLPMVPKMGFAVVDVRSVADLHIKAMESSQAAGERFLAGGDYYYFSDVAAVLREAYPKHKIPRLAMPDFLVKLLSNFDKSIKQVLPEIGAERKTDISKARQVLNWEPINSKEAILATASSLIEHKVL